MPAESAATTAERLRQQRSYDDGMGDGYQLALAPMPEWFSKPYKLMLAYERGYIFGRELRLSEQQAQAT